MSLEAEQAVVAAAISSAEQYDAVSQIITSHDFTDETQRVIWDATSALREAARVVDVVTLSAFLDRSSRWQLLRVGPALDFVSALLDVSHSLKASTVYADIVKQASMNRKLLAYSESIKELSHDGELDADEKLGRTYEMLAPLTAGVPDGFSTYREAAMEAVDDIIALRARGGGLSGVSTGFEDIDEITGGLQRSDLIYVGARPSMGKTVFGMNVADSVARENPVLVFSLEMPKRTLAKRTLSALSGINMTDVMRGNIDDQGNARITAAGIQIAKMNMRIDDSAGLHVDQVRTRARIAARKEMPALIVIDYLTLMRGKGDSKHLEVSYISKSLKAMAKEFDCPVVCLAQLNRGLEARPDKRPKLSDLRESGSIEEDADVVVFLYRDEVYDSDSDRSGILEVNIAKNRNGEIGTRFLKSELQYQRFSKIDRVIPPIKKREGGGMLAKALNSKAGEGAAINDSVGF